MEVVKYSLFKIKKVRRNEALTHPKRSTDEPLNVSVEKTDNRSGHHLSVITVTDPNTMAKDGKCSKFLYARSWHVLRILFKITKMHY